MLYAIFDDVSGSIWIEILPLFFMNLLLLYTSKLINVIDDTTTVVAWRDSYYYNTIAKISKEF